MIDNSILFPMSADALYIVCGVYSMCGLLSALFAYAVLVLSTYSVAYKWGLLVDYLPFGR